VSARAAAQQRRDSPLSSITNTTDGNGGADAVEREESLRAENLAVLDDLKSRLERAETASQQYQRQAEVLQSRLDETLKEQATLEEKIHEGEERLEGLQNERRDAVRQIREMENIYEAEKSAMNKEKEEMANREEEMQTVIQRLKDSLAQRNGTANDDELRPSRHCEHRPLWRSDMWKTAADN
jgi:chromosome segregation ATPase